MTARFRFHHLGLAVPDMDQARAVYEEQFGYQLLDGPYEEPSQQAILAFVGTGDAGDVCIELIAPLGDDSHIHNHLKQGKGAYHVCYEVDDIEQTVADLKAERWIHVSGPTPTVTFHGRAIAWMFAPTRQLVEFVQAETADASSSLPETSHPETSLSDLADAAPAT